MKKLIVTVCACVLSFGALLAQDWDQILKIVASDREAQNEFGTCVKMSGNYAIVGVPKESEDAVGANTMAAAGAAYILYFNGTTWVQQQKIVAADRAAGDLFGFTVDISENYAIVGAYKESEDAAGAVTLSEAGSAYIFVRSGETWAQQQKIVASDRALTDWFGYAVSISGSYAIVGAFYEDEDASGENSMTSAGSAYIYHFNGISWEQQQKIAPNVRNFSDYFGGNVAIDGDHAIVGAIYEDEDENDENYVSAAGAAYIFVRDGVTWTQQNKIVASDRAASVYFGNSIDIFGTYAIVGCRMGSSNADGLDYISSAGEAYIYYFNGVSWDQQQKIVASDRAENDNFGKAVAISADYAVIGAYSEDHNADGADSLAYAGSSYIFTRSETIWTQEQKIVPIDRGQSDRFGNSVAISGSNIIVAAYHEDHDQGGSNYMYDAGAVYVFENTSDVPLPVELVNFSANVNHNSVELTWTTESEVNNLGFIVEKRKTGMNDWASVSSYLSDPTLIGAGTVTETRNYCFTDNDIEPGAVYEYRLGDVDYNNTLTWKRTLVVTVDAQEVSPSLTFGLQEIYPNPFNPSVTLNYGVSSAGQTSLQIYNMNGQLVETLLNQNLPAGDHSTVWRPLNMSTGMYFVRLQSGNLVNMQKVLYLK